MEHDASAALSRDGQIVAAISEERLSRIKCQWGYPWRALDECLRMAGIHRRDVDVFCAALNKFPACYFHKPTWWRERAERWHRARRRFFGRPEEVTVTISDFFAELRRRGMVAADLFDWDRFRADGFEKAQVRFVDHHYAHAYSAAAFSGFNNALVVTVDCVGACCTQDETEVHSPESIFLQNLVPLSHTTSVFTGGRLQRIHWSDLNGSPGSFYGSVTETLGFISPRHEGKVTGLAAWGKNLALDPAFRRVLGVSADRTHFVSKQIWERNLNISEARKKVIRNVSQGHTREDISGSAQRILEEAVMGHVQWALRQSGQRNLAVAGGVFGNVKLNQHLMELPEAEHIFVFPAMSDAGLAVAAARMAAEAHGHPEGEAPRTLSSVQLRDVYWGPSYSNETIEALLKKSRFRHERLSRSEWPHRIARLVAEGKVVGLFQGRMEFGPRALGNRSILASPVDARINDDLNRRLSRSEFMPFAPSVRLERCGEIFENFSKGAHAAEFMTVTYTVREEWRSRIPAVVHVDGTARPQVVLREKNQNFYEIIQAYEAVTGLPVVINTSFNVHEEPIVCRPEEALKALRENRIDILFLEDYCVLKSA
jgi:carbamoyltransferase